MEKRAGATFNALTYLSSPSPARQKGKLKSYCEVVGYLLATYATEAINTKASMDIMNFMQPAGRSAVEYAQEIWTKVLRYRPCLRQVTSQRNIH